MASRTHRVASRVSNSYTPTRTQSSAPTWLESPQNLYQVDTTLRLSLQHRKKNADVRIIRTFQPFTNSVCLLVESMERAAGLPEKFICKLADRRFGDWRYKPWSMELESNFQEKLASYGSAPQLNKHGPSSEDPQWFREFAHWQSFDAARRSEQRAYETLTEAQRLGLIPMYFGSARINMSTSSPIHPSIDTIDGLLLEFIPGNTMASIRPGVDISHAEAEDVSQRVIALGRHLRRFGVAHCDIHSNNVIIRRDNKHPVLIDWGQAEFHCLSQYDTLEGRWTDHAMGQDYQIDIRRMLRGPDDNVWHRFRTPISDEEQIRMAEVNGWATRNWLVSSLPQDEREKFYYEDTAIDERHRLRWKVKPGVRTRLIDDPVP